MPMSTESPSIIAFDETTMITLTGELEGGCGIIYSWDVFKVMAMMAGVGVAGDVNKYKASRGKLRVVKRRSFTSATITNSYIIK